MKQKTQKAALFLSVLFANLFALSHASFAHCEIPCGIYADTTRVVMISEHVTTIEKSMKQIVTLSKADVIDYNQLVRWVNNKEEHANKIQSIATQYFMYQRVKISDDAKQIKKNQQLLDLLHKLSVYAMKAKQTTDLENVKNMTKSLEEFSKLYFVKAHKHH